MPDAASTAPPKEQEALRKEAERRLRARAPAPTASRDDALQLLQELQIHQVELEMQNEELQRTQEELERMRRRYQLLFREAPVGYVSLRADGTIIEANQALAGILGVLPQRLPGSQLAQWCAQDSRATLELHLRNVLNGSKGENCQLDLWSEQGFELKVHLNTVLASPDGNETELYTTVSDVTARHRAETALARSERRYQEMFEHAPLPYLSMDEAAVILDVNRAWLEVLGYRDKTEVVGRAFGDFQTPSARAGFQERLARFREQGRLQQKRLDLQHRNGSTVFTVADCTFVDDPVADRRVTQCIFADVTEQFRLLEELNRFRAQVDQSADGIFTIDLGSGTVIECNQGAAGVLGQTRDDLLGASAEDLGIRLAELEAADEAPESGQRPLVVTRLVRTDGTHLPVELSASRVPDPHQPSLVVVARDISERLEAEQRLLEKSRQIEQAHREWLVAFDSLNDPIFLHDDQGRVLRANRAYARRAGVEISEVLGRPYWELFPRSSGPTPGCLRSQDATDSREMEEELVLEDGAVLQSRASSIFDGDGSYRFSIHILTDVTERRRHQEQLFGALEATVGAISQAMEMRDPYTAGHQQRVARLAVAIARDMGLEPEAVNGIDLGGRIHDIGKIHIPAEILNRPGRLPPREFDLIKSHAQVGYEIIKDIEFPWPVAEMARQHHERLDGSGYPRGLKGPDIILEARIIAIADVVEAMTTHRPYRPALGIDKALEEIAAKRGVMFDPVAVDACVSLFREDRFSFEQE